MRRDLNRKGHRDATHESRTAIRRSPRVAFGQTGTVKHVGPAHNTVKEFVARLLAVKIALRSGMDRPTVVIMPCMRTGAFG
jgi:hypothetical protein